MHGIDGVQIHVHLLLENLIFPPSTWMQCVGTREGGRAGGQHHLVTKLAAQEKHSTESTKAVCVGPLSVLGAAESRFSCWRIHCLECCVYFAVVLPLDAEWAQQVHKSRVTGWEHSPEKARGLFIVQSRAEKEVWEELNHLWGNRREQRMVATKSSPRVRVAYQLQWLPDS